MKITPTLSAAALALLSIAPQTTNAATLTADLNVLAVVLDTCLVTSASTLTFANPSATAATNETTPGTITILCTGAHNDVTVTLGGGANAAGGVRKMADTQSNLLPYSVFSNAGHTSAVAIDGEIYNDDLAPATPVVLTVYGQVPAGTYAAGTYRDTVLVTLNY